MKRSVAMDGDWRQQLGKDGEALACAALERRGYAILERRYRTRFGEIDIVARDGPTLVFVEVKTRAGTAFGGAAVAVTAWKQRRLVQLALDYMARRRVGECPCRFDVVAIEMETDGPRVTVYPHAFDA